MSRIEGRTNIWWARADWFSSLSAGGKEKFLVGPKKEVATVWAPRVHLSRGAHQNFIKEAVGAESDYWSAALTQSLCSANLFRMLGVCAAARRSYLRRCKATGLHFSPADRTNVPQETAMLCDEWMSLMTDRAHRAWNVKNSRSARRPRDGNFIWIYYQ